MAVRSLLQLGDPALRTPAATVADPTSHEISSLARDLHETLLRTRAATGYGRAIAAPQIGAPWRVVVADLGERWVFVNPEITWAGDEVAEWWDACLSFLDTFGRVRRRATISVRWYDLEGAVREERFEGDLSELLQHELDHLDGILAVDRFVSPASCSTRREFERQHRRSSPYAIDGLTGPDPLRISLASLEIDPVFLNTPQLESDPVSERLGMTVLAKLETANPIRSFKGRGADWLLRSLEDDSPMVCASAGNFGQGLAYAARARGRPCIVFAPETANPLKIERMRALGAEVRLEGRDFDAAKDAAREFASVMRAHFVEDGAERAIAEGAGTIAVELGRYPGLLDVVLVPVGNGAMITGIGAWIKAFAPHTRVVGVCAAGAPAMANSWRAREPRPTESVSTIADGIGVREPVPRALEDMYTLVDDMLVVDDEGLIQAMRLAYQHLGVVVEPAGAAGLAAALRYADRFSGQTVAVPLCGGNVTPDQLAAWLASPGGRGSSGDVRFRTSES